MRRYFFISFSVVINNKLIKGSLSFRTKNGFFKEDEVKNLIKIKFPYIEEGTTEINSIFEFENEEDFNRFQS